MKTPLQRVLDALEAGGFDPRQNGRGHAARCPGHDDRIASLTVSEAGDGKALLHCHAGCDLARIVEALGLGVSDLFPTAVQLQETRWRIRDREGRTIAEHVRRDLPDGKAMHWERNGSRGLGGLKSADIPLYGSEHVAKWGASDPVVVVEGERACDALLRRGIRALGTVTGAKGCPNAEPLSVLQGRNVTLWPDHDEPGRSHMALVASRLARVAVSVRLFEWMDAPPGGDAADYRGTTDELCAEMEKVSAASRVGAPAETILRFQTAAEMCASAPIEVPWIVPGYIPRGGLVELDGKVKSGKTTLIARLVREVLDGGTFLGTPVTKGPVTWLTEQPTTSFVDALRHAGLEGRDDLHLLQWHDTRGVPWEEVVEAARAKVAETGSILLVVDTLGQFAGLHGDAEDSAGDAQRALRPLQMATGEGLAVLVARHERKSGGEIGDSARGSSAFTGAADVVMVLRRPEGAQRDTVRVLSAIGRFRETPAEQVIELKDGAYVSLGTALDVAAHEARQKVLGECPQDPKEALKLATLVEHLGLKRTTCQAAVDSLVKDGLLAKIGQGKRGDPWRYYSLGVGFCQNSIPQETAPAETNQTPRELSAKTPAGSGSRNPELQDMDAALAEFEDDPDDKANSILGAPPHWEVSGQ